MLIEISKRLLKDNITYAKSLFKATKEIDDAPSIEMSHVKPWPWIYSFSLQCFHWWCFEQCFVHTFLSVWEDQKCTTRLLHSFSNCTFLWHSFLPIFYDDAVSTKRNAVYYMRLFSKWGAPLLLLLPHWSISWVLLYEIEQKNPRLTYLEKANETYFRPLFKGLNEF